VVAAIVSWPSSHLEVQNGLILTTYHSGLSGLDAQPIRRDPRDDRLRDRRRTDRACRGISARGPGIVKAETLHMEE
jgi:hypothetical protein